MLVFRIVLAIGKTLSCPELKRPETLDPSSNCEYDDAKRRESLKTEGKAMRPLYMLAGAILAGSAAASAGPLYGSELIFPTQDKHVHASSIVECPNGDLLCCWFEGSGERQAPDVAIRGARLKSGASVWSETFPMADTPDFPDCNPVLFVDAHQELRLFWIAVLAGRWEDSLLRCRQAKEYQADGPPHWDWQDDILLKPGDKFAETLAKGYEKIEKGSPGFTTDFGGHAASPLEQLIAAARDPSKNQKGWMTRTHPLVLPTGRILLPLYSDGFYVGLMAISDDRGKTWRASAPIPGVGLNQPSVVRKKDGTLVAYMREEGDMKKRVPRSTSPDNGETWTVPVYTNIPNPNSSLEVIGLRDGRWVMAYNDSEQERDTLALSVSDDEGETWKWTRHLERKKGCSFHYPSIIQARDGRIHVTYTYRVAEGKSIKHVTLDPDWILSPDSP